MCLGAELPDCKEDPKGVDALVLVTYLLGVLDIVVVTPAASVTLSTRSNIPTFCEGTRETEGPAIEIEVLLRTLLRILSRKPSLRVVDKLFPLQENNGQGNVPFEHNAVGVTSRQLVSFFQNSIREKQTMYTFNH